MINIMKQHSFGAFLKHAIALNTLHLLSLMFVDDADNLQTATPLTHPGKQSIMKPNKPPTHGTDSFEQEEEP